MKTPGSKDRILKELEQEKLVLEEINSYLTKNERISDEILESMSHELRTPMVTIKSYSDMLIEGKFGNLTQEQQEKLEKIKANTNLLMDAVFKMLEKSKKRK